MMRIHSSASSAHSLPSSPFADGSRSGLSLIEVIISVAVFLGSLTAILHLLSVGQRSEAMTRLQTEAVMRCEAKMAEVVSGVQELAAVNDELFDDSQAEIADEFSGQWTWSLESADTGTADLLQVTVTTKYFTGGGSIPAAMFSLVRYMRDPQIFLDAALAAEEE